MIKGMYLISLLNNSDVLLLLMKCGSGWGWGEGSQCLLSTLYKSGTVPIK